MTIRFMTQKNSPSGGKNNESGACNALGHEITVTKKGANALIGGEEEIDRRKGDQETSENEKKAKTIPQWNGSKKKSTSDRCP